jgi:hypothetical protein
MVQSNELVTLIVGLGGLWFVLAYREELARVPFSRLLLGAFGANLATWICTVAEGFFWGDLLNLLEHAASAVTAVLLALWCFKVTGSTEERSRS